MLKVYIEEHLRWFKWFGVPKQFKIQQDNQDNCANFWKVGAVQPDEFTVAVWKIRIK